LGLRSYIARAWRKFPYEFLSDATGEISPVAELRRSDALAGSRIGNNPDNKLGSALIRREESLSAIPDSPGIAKARLRQRARTRAQKMPDPRYNGDPRT